ncbi:SseB family protein [Nocardioides pacificus]
MSAPDRFAGTSIPDPGFAGDSGEAAPEVVTALADYAAGRARFADTLAAVQDSRVLVPVVALLGEVEYDEAGLAHDKSSDMAAVLMTGRDGRLALLAFTGTASLQAWNPEARPVPVTLRVAAQSALQDQAAALVVDIAGPVTFVVEGEDLVSLAAGWTLARVGEGYGWIGAPGE